MASLAIKTPVTKLAFDYLPIAAATSIRSATCTAYVWRPAKGVLVSRVEGCFSDEAATLLEAKVRSWTGPCSGSTTGGRRPTT